MRLFVAVPLPDDVVAAITALARPEDVAVRWTAREQWHVTLRFFGEVEDPAAVVDALRPAVSGFGAVDVRLGPRARVLNRHVVCLPVEGLAPLAGVVVAATRDFGDPPPTRAFRGHVTLARARGRITHAPPMAIDCAWPVHAIELVRSHLGRGGSRYETLTTFPL